VPTTDTDGIDPHALEQVLLAARDAGFLGPGPIERHLLHAEGFLAIARAQSVSARPRILDLGSGGGLPGLVIAGGWQEAMLVLLEANQRRAQFLERAVERCGLQSRVQVLHERAEVTGRSPVYRESFDGVVVRSFGPPAVVAECAAPLLRIGGWLLVSEPPRDPATTSVDRSSEKAERVDDDAASARWPANELAPLGLVPIESVHASFGYQLLEQRSSCPEQFPRRNGVPAKRPLF
jgi:16S rRNA (guanine527-N7)-methyltransferase